MCPICGVSLNRIIRGDLIDPVLTDLETLRKRHRSHVAELATAVVALSGLKAELERPGDPTRLRVALEESRRARDRVSRIRAEIDLSGKAIEAELGRRVATADRTGQDPSDLRRRSLRRDRTPEGEKG